MRRASLALVLALALCACGLDLGPVNGWVDAETVAPPLAFEGVAPRGMASVPMQTPVDGHIVLSRNLADQGHYPAIDIEQSISRAMHNLVKSQHFDVVRRFKQLFSRYQRSRDLIAVGAYHAGSDPVLDQAVAMYPRLETYLQQRIDESEPYESAVESSTPSSERAREHLFPPASPLYPGPKEFRHPPVKGTGT